MWRFLRTYCSRGRWKRGDDSVTFKYPRILHSLVFLLLHYFILRFCRHRGLITALMLTFFDTLRPPYYYLKQCTSSFGPNRQILPIIRDWTQVHWSLCFSLSGQTWHQHVNNGFLQTSLKEAHHHRLALFQQALFEGWGSLGEQTSLGQFPVPILALHSPGVPARVARSRAGEPGPRHPAGLRGLRRHFAAGAAAGHRVCQLALFLWHEEAVAHVHGLGGVGGQDLHDQDLLGGRVAHGVQEVVLVAPAAVVHDGAVDVDDGLRGGDHVLPVDQILPVLLLQGQVGREPALVFALELPHFDVGGPFWDLHHVRVALAEGRERRESLIATPHKITGMTQNHRINQAGTALWVQPMENNILLHFSSGHLDFP